MGRAREQSDFAAFAPYLERNLELARRYVDCFDDFDCAYDVLLDDYEPRMTTAEVARLFDELKAELVPLIATLADDQDRVDDSLPARQLPDRPSSGSWSREVVGLMGFDPAGWRIDDAVHPFATGFGSGDVRITTRWDETFFPSALYGAMHECGHGLYEAGIARSLQRTPLGHGESLGLHESQSRLWENMVGRGRAVLRRARATVVEAFGGALAGLDADDAVPRGEPGEAVVHPGRGRRGDLRAAHRAAVRARAGADRGRLAVARSARGVERALARSTSGSRCPTTAQGVLQDVHWSAGLIGYFPTYALGNLIAGQLWEQVHADIPDLDDTDRRRGAGAAARVAARERPPPRREVHDPRACSSGWSVARSPSRRSSPT